MSAKTKLSERLTDPKRSGVYRVSQDAQIRDALSPVDADLVEVDLGGGKDAVLASFASALGFPAMGLESFPFGSAIITNVGSFGLEEAYAPPTPFARVPVLILVGAVKDHPAVVDGQVVVRPIVTITATIDHRFIDGAELATLAKIVRQGIEQPWTLEGFSKPPWEDVKS